MNFDIYLNKNKKIAFLVGAGVSIPSPSKLPSGNEYSEKIINSVVFEEEIIKYGMDIEYLKKILKGCPPYKIRPGEFNRFESMIYSIKHVMDEDLNILKILNDYKEPNELHYNIATLIYQGHIVITTNFDNLIEIAFQRLYADKRHLEIKIFDEEFNLNDLNQPKAVLWKIHGSLQRNGKDTLDSINATFPSCISNTLQENKKRFLKYIIEEFDMVFTGYSGSDDLDIMPLLAKTISSKKIIWIKHADVAEANIESSNTYKEKNIKQTNFRDLTGLNRFVFSATATNNSCRKSPQDFIFISGQTNLLFREILRNFDLEPTIDVNDNTNISFGNLISRWRKGLNLTKTNQLALIYRLFDHYHHRNPHHSFVTNLLSNYLEVLKGSFESLEPSDKLHAANILYNKRTFLEDRSSDFNISKILSLVYSLEFEMKDVKNNCLKNRLLGSILSSLGRISSANIFFESAIEFARTNNNEREELLGITTWRNHLRFNIMNESLPQSEVERMWKLLKSTGYFPLKWQSDYFAVQHAVFNFDDYCLIYNPIKVIENIIFTLNDIERFCIDMGDIVTEAKINMLYGVILFNNTYHTNKYSDSIYNFCRAQVLTQELHWKGLNDVFDIYLPISRSIPEYENLENNLLEELNSTMWAN